MEICRDARIQRALLYVTAVVDMRLAIGKCDLLYTQRQYAVRDQWLRNIIAGRDWPLQWFWAALRCSWIIIFLIPLAGVPREQLPVGAKVLERSQRTCGPLEKGQACMVTHQDIHLF
jgi:hypothetical protein